MSVDNLFDSVRVYNVFDKDFCNNVLNQLSTKNWRTLNNNKQFIKNLYNNWDQTDFFIRKKEEIDTKDIDYMVFEGHIDSSNIINEKISSTLNLYLSDTNKEINDSFNYTQLIFNRYEVGKSNYLHCDSLHDNSDRLFSIICNLNDDFKGGELMLCDRLVELKQGDLVIFPSSKLYPHEILTVTEGTRYSVVSWVFKR